jgi:hypothetical protein
MFKNTIRVWGCISMSASRETLTFLEQLYGQKNDDQCFCVFCARDGKKSFFQFFTDTQDAARFIEKQTEYNCYASVGLFNERPISGRGKEEDVSAIIGLALDLDYDAPGHKKNGLPRKDQVERFIDTFMPECPPSLVVHTGGGYQLWYLFRRPMTLESEADRLLPKRLHQKAEGIFKQMKWSLDNVGDVARILRVPGTTRYKEDAEPCRPTIVKQNDKRYNPSDFDFLPEYKDTGSGDAGEIGLEQPGNPPFTKLQDLLKSSVMFRRTWNKTRSEKELPSQSEYDMSIMSQTIDAGFTVQEAIDTVSEHRKQHGYDPETMKYYERTMRKVMSGDHHKKTHEITVALENADNASVQEQLLEILGIHIKRVLVYSGTKKQWTIETDKGKVNLGDVSELMSFKKFQCRLVDDINHVIDQSLSKVWSKITALIVQLREDVEVKDANHEEMVGDMLTDLLLDSRLHHYKYLVSDYKDTPIHENTADSEVFLYDGRYCVKTGVVYKLMMETFKFDRGITTGMPTLLKKIGMEKRTIHLDVYFYSNGGDADRPKKTTRNVYFFPDSLIPADFTCDDTSEETPEEESPL